MNERIKQLAKQAGFYVSANDAEILIPDPHTEDITGVMDKFAELIVRECGAVAYKAYWSNPETIRGRHIEEKIREHFGVE